jgi:hypothetical protein
MTDFNTDFNTDAITNHTKQNHTNDNPKRPYFVVFCGVLRLQIVL